MVDYTKVLLSETYTFDIGMLVDILEHWDEVILNNFTEEEFLSFKDYAEEENIDVVCCYDNDSVTEIVYDFLAWLCPKAVNIDGKKYYKIEEVKNYLFKFTFGNDFKINNTDKYVEKSEFDKFLKENGFSM